MPKVGEIERVLFEYMPRETAMSFDNVGLMCGDSSARVTKAYLALDATDEVVNKAADAGAELVITHHPLIFNPLKTVDLRGEGATAALAIKRGVSVIAMHTNADRAAGGTNDCLAELLGLKDIEPLAAADPELDGCGRIGRLEREVGFEEFFRLAERRLKPRSARAVAGKGGIRTVAVFGGGGGESVFFAAAQGADAVVTSEIRHHQFLFAKAAGLAALDLGHYETEACVLGFFERILKERFPAVTTLLSDYREDLFVKCL